MQVVITDASWPQRQAFLAALARCLDGMYCRAHWYPGSEQRRAAFKQRFPQAQSLGRAVPEAGQPKGHLKAEPWLLITGDGAAPAEQGCGWWGCGFSCWGCGGCEGCGGCMTQVQPCVCVKMHASQFGSCGTRCSVCICAGGGWLTHCAVCATPAVSTRRAPCQNAHKAAVAPLALLLTANLPALSPLLASAGPLRVKVCRLKRPRLATRAGGVCCRRWC